MGAGCIIVCIIFWCMWIYYDILCTNVILNSINLSHPLTCDGDSNGMQWAMTYFDDPWWSLMILDDPLPEKKTNPFLQVLRRLWIPACLLFFFFHSCFDNSSWPKANRRGWLSSHRADARIYRKMTYTISKNALAGLITNKTVQQCSSITGTVTWDLPFHRNYDLRCLRKITVGCWKNEGTPRPQSSFCICWLLSIILLPEIAWYVSKGGQKG